MWKINGKIGFDDRLLTIILLPVVSLIIPFIFFGMRFDREPLFTGNVYLNVVIMTTVIWLGNRYIMIWARTKYPSFTNVRKRLWVQSLTMFWYTIVTNNLLGYLLDICGIKQEKHYAGFDTFNVIVSSNAASIFCSLTVVAIYESIYFMNELRQSVEEKELLKRESLHAQLSALKTQVNPHFLFNNLNTLCSIIPEDPDKAVVFVQQMSKVYRHILEVQDEQSIPLKDELDVMKAYAFLLHTRFGDNLDITIDVPEEKLTKRIIPLSLQILMENAIKHNIVTSDKPLKVEVTASNGRLEVKNNLQKKNQINISTGIGLENIRNRCRLLSQDKVLVTENENSFTVSIPLIEN
ncbi:MAG: histidine kinase [Bacteroidetes bacterium]|nr:histidine kinase [Bacteroidota bacterium]